MIGIVGAGQIVAAAHLPAYRQAEFPVTAIYDADPAKAFALADEYGLGQALTLDVLLEHPDLQVLDVALPPAAQVPVIEAALTHGKHVLAQKPLARTLCDAEALVDCAEQAGLHLLVNQQMRWSPVIQAIRAAIHNGRLGELRALHIDLDLPMPPGGHGGWLWDEPRFTALFNTLHLLDSARYLLGEPLSLLASVGHHDPHLTLAGDTDVMVALEFASAHVCLTDRRNAFDDHRATFRATGTNGALRGRFGLWTDYPSGVADDIEYACPGESWQRVETHGRWIPDAFVGPMGEMVSALHNGTTPTITGRDHLRTLRLVEAIYESAASGQRVVLGA